MDRQVFFIFTTISLLTLSLCFNTPTSKADSWLIHFPLPAPENRIGKQMPPHHEPDAVLINVGGNGQPGFPAFPGLPGGGPGVFGVPNNPGMPPGPWFPGVNRGQGGVPGFGIPGRVPQLPSNPGVFGTPGQGIPGFPNVYGIPESHGWPGNPGGPTIYTTASGSGVFLTPGGQGGPSVRNGQGIFGEPNAGREPRFVPDQGNFGVPNGPVQPGGPSFVQPGVFPTAGGGAIPFPPVPGFFFPSGTPNMPQPSGDFPSARGGQPEDFIPGGVNGFGNGGLFPGVFFPKPSFIPNNPEISGYPQGNFPRREIHRGAGDREVSDDDPVGDMFPLINKSALRSAVSN